MLTNLVVTLEVMGAELSSAAQEMIVNELVGRYSDQQIGEALGRCRRELKFGRLTLADILERVGELTPDAIDELEAREAWQTAAQFARYHVVSSPEGTYMLQARDQIVWNEDRSRIVRTIHTPTPELPQRILDTVEHIGGWAAIKEATPKSFPFVQKAFFEHYKAWKQMETYRSRRPELSGSQDPELSAAVQQLAEKTKF